MVSLKDQWSNFDTKRPVVAATYGLDFQLVNELVTGDRGYRAGSVVFANDENLTLEETTFPENSTRYNIETIKSKRGDFHPKIVLQAGAKGLNFLIGSHNFTQSALRINSELTGFTTIPFTSPHERILNQIEDFLKNLKQFAGTNSKETMEEILESLRKRVAPASVKQEDFHFLHSFEDSLLELVEEKIPSVQSVTVMSPVHSSDREWIEDFIARFGGRSEILIDSEGTKISDGVQDLYKSQKTEIIKKEGRGPVHAKLYIFSSEVEDWILYGSPNFTRTAWSKPFENGGNWETAVLVRSPKDFDWRKLFENDLKLKEIEDLRELDLTEPKPYDGRKEKRKFSTVGEWDRKNLILTANKQTVEEKLTLRIYDQKDNIIQKKELEINNRKQKIKLSELVEQVPNYVEVVSEEGKNERIKINSVSLIPPSEEKGLRKNIRRLMRRIVSTKDNLPISSEQPPPTGIINPPDWYSPGSGEGGSGSPPGSVDIDYLRESRAKFKRWIEEKLESAKENEVLDRWVKEFLNRLEILLDASFYKTLEKRPNHKYLVGTMKTIEKELESLNLEKLPSNPEEFWKKQMPRYAIEEKILSNFFVYDEVYRKIYSDSFTDENTPKDYQINIDRIKKLLEFFEKLPKKETLREEIEKNLNEEKEALDSIDELNSFESFSNLREILEFRVEQ